MVLKKRKNESKSNSNFFPRQKNLMKAVGISLVVLLMLVLVFYGAREVLFGKVIQPPASYFPLDGPNDNGLTVGNEVTFVAGKVTNAASFTGGSASYISLNKDILNGKTDFSVSFWAKPGINKDKGTFLSAAKLYSDEFVVGYENDGQTLFVELKNSKLTFQSTLNFKTVTDWHHFTITRSGDIVHIFVDGILRRKGDFAGSVVGPLNVESLILGQEQDCTSTNPCSSASSPALSGGSMGNIAGKALILPPSDGPSDSPSAGDKTGGSGVPAGVPSGGGDTGAALTDGGVGTATTDGTKTLPGESTSGSGTTPPDSTSPKDGSTTSGGTTGEGTTTTSSTLSTNTATFESSQAYVGLLDELKFFDRVLTAEEARSLFNPPEDCTDAGNTDEDGDEKSNCYDDDCWPVCEGLGCSLDGNGGYVVASTISDATKSPTEINYGCCPTEDYCYHPDAGTGVPGGCFEYAALILDAHLNCGDADDWDVCGQVMPPPATMGGLVNTGAGSISSGSTLGTSSSSVILSDSHKYYCDGNEWTECTSTQTVGGFLCLNSQWYECNSPPTGWACTDKEQWGEDGDNDGIVDGDDNCPSIANGDQANGDTDGLGDTCDNCVDNANPDQMNTDGDNYGNVCDNDDDNDGVNDNPDNCPLVANADQADTDEDTEGDACENDIDGDGVLDECTDTVTENCGDNCLLVSNANQVNFDNDNQGDVCDSDDDNDGVDDNIDSDDNNARICQDSDNDGCDDCTTAGTAQPNNDGLDSDNDRLCNAGDPDDDNDGLEDNDEDVNQDGQQDNGETSPINPDSDDDDISDGDEDPDSAGSIQPGPDNCPLMINTNQANDDNDGQGNACDDDDDNDDILDASDDCPSSGSPLTVSSNGCLRGDLNKDEQFTIVDLIPIIKHIHRSPALADPSQADANCDGQVDVRDITKVMDAIVLNWQGITCS